MRKFCAAGVPCLKPVTRFLNGPCLTEMFPFMLDGGMLDGEYSRGRPRPRRSSAPSAPSTGARHGKVTPGCSLYSPAACASLYVRVHQDRYTIQCVQTNSHFSTNFSTVIIYQFFK